MSYYCKDCKYLNQKDECVGDGHEYACCRFVLKVEKPKPKYYINEDDEICRNYYDEDDY